MMATNETTMLKKEVAEQMAMFLREQDGPKPGRILEIGTGWAESAQFFSCQKPSWKIYTIDAFGLYGDGRIYRTLEHEKVLAINYRIQQMGNVIQILGNSSSIPWELPIDLLFLDGDHTREGVKKDWMQFSPWVRRGGIVVFDDYNQPNNPANGVKDFVAELASCWTSFKLTYQGYYCAILKRISDVESDI
jgi:predicted O-methyltransferase YrrM